MKKLLIVTLIAMFALTAVACTPTTSEQTSESPAPTAEATSQPAEESGVVAEVNGTQLSLEDYNTLLETFAQTYMYSSAEDLSTVLGEEDLALFKDDVLSQLIYSAVLVDKADELGLSELSADTLSLIEENIASYNEDLHTQFSYQAQSDALEDTTIDVETRTQELIDEYIEDSGFTDEYVRKVMTESEILANMFEYSIADIIVSDTDIQAEYDRLVAEQSALDEEDPELSAANYTNAANYVQVINPAQLGNIHYVKHVLIPFTDEDEAAISAAATAGEDDEAIDALTQQALENIKELADEVYDKAIDGEDFDSLIVEYGADTGMTVEPTMTTGYPVYVGSNMIPEFEEASLALEEVGDISEPVGGVYGYHIIRLETIAEPGIIPLENVSNTIEQIVYADLQDEKWFADYDFWESEATIVRNYEVIGLTQEQVDAARVSYDERIQAEEEASQQLENLESEPIEVPED